MYSKKALAVIAVLAFSIIAFAPVSDGADEDEPESELLTVEYTGGAIYNTGADDAKGGNNFFYDCIIVLIIGLAAAGALHVKAHKK